jgi:hypothetical protein
LQEVLQKGIENPEKSCKLHLPVFNRVVPSYDLADNIFFLSKEKQ